MICGRIAAPTSRKKVSRASPRAAKSPAAVERREAAVVR
jgi:hypothetical protein